MTRPKKIYLLMWRLFARPRTIRAAVAYMKAALPADTLHLIRGSRRSELHVFHFGVGAWVRGELGLWKENSPLFRACDEPSADDASGVLLEALREDLVRTATPREMAESREAWRKFEEASAAEDRAWSEGVAAKDAAITDRRCPFCGMPCPSYRRTCKHCRGEVGVTTVEAVQRKLDGVLRQAGCAGYDARRARADAAACRRDVRADAAARGDAADEPFFNFVAAEGAGVFTFYGPTVCVYVVRAGEQALRDRFERLGMDEVGKAWGILALEFGKPEPDLAMGPPLALQWLEGAEGAG